MNAYYDIYKESKNKGRGPAFKRVVETFYGPTDILEIGTIRDLRSDAVGGDGWSTFWWCDYINKHGGKLVIVDINPQAIEACKEAVSDFADKIEIEFHVDDGTKYISDEYDFIYLDGADCPKEMLDQFNNINRQKTSILCDDFSEKGILLYGGLKSEETEESHQNFNNTNLIETSFVNCKILSIDNNQAGGHPLAFYPKIEK